MMYKVTSALVALFLFFACANATGSNVYVNLVNALIANSNLNTANSGFTAYGLSAPTTTCTAANSAYPTLAALGGSSFTTLNICYGSSVAYPYRTAGSNTGLENTLISNWAALLQTQYNKAIVVNPVSVTVGTSGLVPSLTNALNTAGQCQVAISSLFQTTDRDSTLTPSCPYSSSYSGAYVGPLGNTESANITSLSQLNNASVIIAIARSSAALSIVQTNYPRAQILFTTSTTESINFAVNSTAHVAIGDAPVILYTSAATNPNLCGGSQCRTLSLNNPSNLVAYAVPQVTSTTTMAPTTTNAAATVVAAFAVVVVAVIALVF